MERRAFAAILLSILVIIGWTYLFPPPPPVERPDEPTVAEGEETTGRTDVPPALDPAVEDATEEAPPAEAIAEASQRNVRVETDVFDVQLTNRGARAVSWRLKDYRNKSGEALELIPRFADEGPSGLLAISAESSRLTELLRDALFQVETDETADGPVVTFRWSDGRSIEVERQLAFQRDGYLVDFKQTIVDRGQQTDSGLEIGPGFGAQERKSGRSRFYQQSGGGVWFSDGDVTHKKTGKLDDQRALTGAVEWAGLEDQYFAALAIPGGQRIVAEWTVAERPVFRPGDDESETPEPTEHPSVAIRIPSDGMQLYVGPKQIDSLQAAGYELDRTIKFYGWIDWLARLIYSGLLWIQGNIAGNWGLAIIIATLALRATLFLPNQFAMVRMKKSQVEMQRIQPMIKAVQNKYRKRKDAESRAAMQRETMDLYRKEGINPAGPVLGCLPMLLQFPILIAFYNMLTVAIELRGAPFGLWIQDLSIPDPFWITPILMGVTMFAQQRMSMTKAKDPQQRQQQQILMFMPFVFTALCIGAPSGLVLYWFVNNILGMGQQWLVNKQFARANDTTSGKTAKKAGSKSPQTRNA